MYFCKGISVKGFQVLFFLSIPWFCCQTCIIWNTVIKTFKSHSQVLKHAHFVYLTFHAQSLSDHLCLRCHWKSLSVSPNQLSLTELLPGSQHIYSIIKCFFFFSFQNSLKDEDLSCNRSNLKEKNPCYSRNAPDYVCVISLE